ncbi:nitroreductase/quinone reductase family protein [Actinoplanes sp. CA-015351]|uniref:nitroreductase/quinone reductase family protein n=1 Tax=Actinoplanes sp. CA-015351 TaxID=3239897 RepID=UPI003D9932B1
MILAYVEDGPNLVTLDMNGWAPPEPVWWRNLHACEVARVELPDGARQVRGRAAHGSVRDRWWSLFQTLDKHLDEYASRRPSPTAVVVLEPA